MFLILSSLIPLAIVGAHKFYTALTNFLGLISYWGSAYGAIVLVEHVLFRRNAAAYNIEDWNNPRRLPSGIAALGAGACSFGLVVSCMDQVWFVGPIAKSTGDIGFEVAFALSAILYVPFRTLELRIRGSL